MAAINFRSYRADVAAHRHGFHQLVLPRTGALELEIDGRGGRVDADGAAFVGAGERHAFEARGPNRFLVLDLPSAQAGPVEAALAARRFVPLRPRARALLTCLGDTLPGRDEAALMWSHLLLDALHDGDDAPADAGVRVAHALIAGEPERALDSAALARLAGLSRAQFYRRFSARYGLAPAALRREWRLALALARLREGDASIADIAGEVGYSEHSALTRALRRGRLGTPRELRRSNHG
ncbi:MAG: helix-turn-helix transcriptional regulator [Rhodanobacteraceae bacterium]|jgi:AraC-like DNA-binding protein|nr:helix-turn-helix transcriptional regulator [Rhodanobacteraceae bacterium]